MGPDRSHPDSSTTRSSESGGSFVLDKRVSVSRQVVVKYLRGGAVLLNTESEEYFALDEVGTRMWKAVTASASVREAFETLSGEYDVEPETLRGDLSALVQRLEQRGLLVLEDAKQGDD